MKVLFIQPPYRDFYTTEIRNYPFGLVYLATKIKDMAEVKIYDLRKGKKVIKEHEFQELGQFYFRKYSPFSLFRDFYNFGTKAENVKTIIEKERPHLVCISSLFTPYYREAEEIAEYVKTVDSSIITVIGGHHPTFFPKETLFNRNIDFVIRGEGESPLVHLIEALEKGKKPSYHGICYRERHMFHISEPNYERDINLIPDRSLIEADGYKFGKKSLTFLLTQRGCPVSCDFCGKMNQPLRTKHLSTLEEELNEIENLGIKVIDIEDDFFNFSRERLRAILQLFSRFNFDFYVMNGLYPMNFDREIVELFERAGFRKLNISIVDLSEEILRGVRRKIDLSFFDYLENSILLFEVHFIIGLPGQKKEDVLKDIEFLSQRRALLGPSPFYLAPGSRLFEIEGIRDLDILRKISRSSFLFSPNPEFKRETIYTYLLLSRFINYVKRFIDKYEIEKIEDILELTEGKEREILKLLLEKRKFFYIDERTGDTKEEVQDPSIVEGFFGRVKSIKGFKRKKKIEL